MINMLKRLTHESSQRFQDIKYSISRKQFILGADAQVSLDGVDYQIKEEGRGGNSFIFALIPIQGEDERGMAIKISNSYVKEHKNRLKRTVGELGWFEKKAKRFEREIEALKKAKDNKQNDYIVEIYHDGLIELPVIKWDGCIHGHESFLYYTMELADESLKDYLGNSENALLLSEKVVLLRQLIDDLQKLHSLEIYHRDIKAGNILKFEQTWKIADLGLIEYREDDLILDGDREKIGPVSRLSPEATNKFLGNQILDDYQIEKIIDESSDMYQLGLLFWFVCQGDIPVGTVEESDFYFSRELPELFHDVLDPMLQFSKKRRARVGLPKIRQNIDLLKIKLGI